MKKVLLIGLDGATFSILDPMIKDGVMPFLGKFNSEGVRGNLRSVIPPLTPPAWTSLMTGRSPGHHGIFDFFRMESSENRHIRFVTSNDVSCETVWSMASRNGAKVAALNFPLMFPAPKLSGYVIPGWVPWRLLRLACHPEQLFEQLKQLPGFNPKELAMDIKLEEKATEGGPESEYESWVELHTRREHNWLQIFSHLWKEDDIQLAGIVFDGVDKLQHLCWRFIHPQLAASLTTDREKRIRDLCLEYYRSLDRTIEQMADQAGPETTILIASDHGFGSTQDVFHVNAWLGIKGYLTWSESSRKEQEDQSALLGVGSVARHTYMLDWDGTKAFTTTPTSNGVYIVASPNGDSKGVSQSQYESFREQLMADLMELTVPGTGEPVVSEIWTREQAFSGPQMSLAPDLTLGLRDGGLVSILPSQESITSRPEIAGAHRPEGVFMARGPGIRKGWTSSELSILDVMPSMLYCLDLPVPDDLEGRVPEEIFEPEVIRTRPVKTGGGLEPAELPAPPPSGQTLELGPEEEAVLVDRLRELGYIE